MTQWIKRFKKVFAFKPRIVLAIIAGIFALAPFVLQFHFLADDLQLIHASILNPFPAFTDFGGDLNRTLLRPLVSFSLVLNYWISGWNPWSFHLVNMLIHVFNAFLCVRIVSVLTHSKNPYTLATGLCFFILPQGLVNAYWVAGRTDLISFAWTMTALLLTYDYFQRGSSRSLLLSGICYTFALMSKETALLFVVYQCVIASLFHLSPLDRISRNRMATVFGVTVGLSLAYFVYRLQVFGAFFGTQGLSEPASLARISGWSLQGIWSIIVPFDPIDIRALWMLNRIGTLFALFPIAALAIFIAIRFMRLERRDHIHFSILATGALLCLAIYFKSFPTGRLAYPIMPLAIAALIIAVSPGPSRFHSSTHVLTAYIICIVIASIAVVYNFERLSRIARSAQMAAIEPLGDIDSSFVIAPIGRIGQIWVESGLSFKYPASATLPHNRIRAITLSPFEGNTFTNLWTPYEMHLRSDTLFLKSRELLSGFVPATSQKYLSLNPTLSGAIRIHPISFSSYRNGIAEAVMIYPFRGNHAEVIYFQNGTISRVPFSKFRQAFSR